MNKPEQLRLAADIIEKNLPWECYNGAAGKWTASTIDPCALIYNGIKIRIAPPPPEPVPLTAEDVPMGSWVKGRGSRGIFGSSVLNINPDGVVLASGGIPTLRQVTWAQLEEQYVIKRPGSDTWEPCSKPA